MSPRCPDLRKTIRPHDPCDLEGKASSRGPGRPLGHRRRSSRGCVRGRNPHAGPGGGPRRLIELTDGDGVHAGEVADAVESDAGIAIAVMRAANNGDGPAGRIGGVQEAVEALTPEACGRSPARSARTIRSRPRAPLQRPGNASAATRLPPATPRTVWPTPPSPGQRDQLAVAALLHDVGQLVVARALRRRLRRLTPRPRRPEERVHARAPRARDRPRAGRLRPRPPLGAQARDRRRDRAPSLARGRGPPPP